MPTEMKLPPNSLPYRALIIDLDGTLIAKDQISPAVLEAVGRISRSIPVSIATGRESSHVIHFARQLGLSAPQICDGGAMALDPANGKPLWTSPLDERQAPKILGHLAGHGIPFLATHPTGTITSVDDVHSWDLTRISALDIEESVADAVVAQFADDPVLHVVKVFLPYNGLWAVDFTRYGVDKGSAARKLAKMLGIGTCQIVAVGDSYNDIPMLRACGFRIAMGNAPEELKAIAHHVAPSATEDGLAIAIRDLIEPAVKTSAIGHSIA